MTMNKLILLAFLTASVSVQAQDGQSVLLHKKLDTAADAVVMMCDNIGGVITQQTPHALTCRFQMREIIQEFHFSLLSLSIGTRISWKYATNVDNAPPLSEQVNTKLAEALKKAQ